jgi:hypothetical protein
VDPLQKAPSGLFVGRRMVERPAYEGSWLARTQFIQIAPSRPAWVARSARGAVAKTAAIKLSLPSDARRSNKPMTHTMIVLPQHYVDQLGEHATHPAAHVPHIRPGSLTCTGRRLNSLRYGEQRAHRLAGARPRDHDSIWADDLARAYDLLRT